ncbi:hypothetical protein QN277_016504 [Acacia crassicarpa]|uniref:Transmembrane protein n=1 Tax=Acacia crassicarpa TaxID=499986 RepID=A0AAE1TBL5_9FABA|nr:hypothetical protein QN277_016504 [Acacia crassicarpa]
MEKKSRLRRVLNWLNDSIFGRTIGSLSCVVGLLCYTLSSSFESLFGEWNPTTIVFHIILSSIISVVVVFEVVIIFVAKSRDSIVSKSKPHVQFLVLMLTSLYSFFADRYTKGRPDTWSVVSSVAFALASLCLSRQIKPGFDVGLFGFFLGRVTVQLMKIHLIFILVAAGFCYPLVVLKTYSESQLENGESSAQELKEILIHNKNRASFGMGQDKKTSENGDSSAEGIDDDDGNRASFGMGQDKAGQITHRRHAGNVSPSPSPSPSPSALLTQDDDRSARSRSGKGGSSSSSNDPLLARLPANGSKSFEKFPEAADTEQFLSDLQERETWQVPLLSPRLTQDDDKSFEKLAEAADTEQFQSDLQELERSQLLPPQDLQELERWPQPQPQKLGRRRRKQLQRERRQRRQWERQLL